MTLKQFFKTSCALLAMSIVPAYSSSAQNGDNGDWKFITVAPPSSPQVQQFTRYPNLEPRLSDEQKLALLRQKVKYVFVLFQENRSFDHYFGTYPGATGLFSQSPAATSGFVQEIVNTDGTVGTISPFLIPQTVTAVTGATVPLYPADTASVDHSHSGIDNSLDLDLLNIAQNDRYALNEEKLTTKGGVIVSTATGLPPTSPPTLAQKQMGELVMAHVDCDTVPFLWQYADRFTLFDNFHMTIIGPSTPNAIAMIAGQSGETQWVLHPSEGGTGKDNEPVVNDGGPFAGSTLDTSPGPKPPYNPEDESPATPLLNQTYASLPLSFMGKNINATVASDENPTVNLADVKQDIAKIASNNLPPTAWGWYQEGYDPAPADDQPTGTGDNYSNYIIHHNGPQYFGYIGDNPAVASNLHGLADFFTAVAQQKLPSTGGVFYVRGGYGNLDGLKPVDPNPALATVFPGNDDHPGYSDAQISEALLADEINAIASSPYWEHSAIIITYDETDGLYDHAVPQIRAFDPEGAALSGGPRIPALVISPYSQVHAISNEYSEHSSIIRFIDLLFGLTPLADLPDEANARTLGQTLFNQPYLGPADDQVPGMGDLFSAFDNNRLLGFEPPLPPEFAVIPKSMVLSLPHYGGNGCRALFITPTDYVDGKLIDPPPADFNPRPSTNPGIPTSGTWTP